MNYLAHLYLSPRTTLAVVGNLMGDFRKHVSATDLPEGVLLGIENHCRVDKFTDSHLEVRRLRNLFSKNRRRFAGIILDVVFDHFLSRHWHMFHDEDRLEYIGYLYNCLHRGRSLMPSHMQKVVDYMIEENWLGSYIDLAGIDICLNRMSRRIRFDNHLYGAIEEVEENYSVLESGFLGFFPQLIEHVNKYSGDSLLN